MIDSQQPSVSIDLNPDGVEAQLGAPGRGCAVLGEPLTGEQAQLPLLARADGGERPEVLPAPRRWADAGLDLAEDEAALVGGDDVELAVAGAEVGVEHGQPTRFQMTAREALAGSTKGAAGVWTSHAAKLRRSERHVCDVCDNGATRIANRPGYPRM